MTLLGCSVRCAPSALGYSDVQIALAIGSTPEDVAAPSARSNGIEPSYKLVDTCAAEFAAVTPYYYSTWEEDE